MLAVINYYFFRYFRFLALTIMIDRFFWILFKIRTNRGRKIRGSPVQYACTHVVFSICSIHKLDNVRVGNKGKKSKANFQTMAFFRGIGETNMHFRAMEFRAVDSRGARVARGTMSPSFFGNIQVKISFSYHF